MARRLPPNIKLLLDFAPLGLFFVAYKLGGIETATAVLIAVTALVLAIIYWAERKIAPAPLITGIIVAVFGGLTLALNDPQFIKIKPTIINLIFAAILLVGVFGFKKGLLKPVLDVAFQLTDEGWRVLSCRWGVFFLFLAGLNEFIWRNFPESFWVNFKVFGMFTLTIVFAMAQYRLLERYSAKK